MGLKLDLPALKIRRGSTSGGRKLANRGHVGLMASEMCGCRLPRIICKSPSLPRLPSATDGPSVSGKAELQ